MNEVLHRSLQKLDFFLLESTAALLLAKKYLKQDSPPDVKMELMISQKLDQLGVFWAIPLCLLYGLGLLSGGAVQPVNQHESYSVLHI